MKKYYCELGAHDGIAQSRSIDLEKDANYIGILIEPEKKSYEKLIKNRSSRNIFVNCACHSFQTGLAELDFNNSGLMGGLEGSLDWNHRSNYNISKVEVKPLQYILDENDIKILEYLFLDVEGLEFDVLCGIDYNKTIIKNIEVEIHYDKDTEKIKNLLLENNYTLSRLINNDGLPKLEFKL